MKVKIGLAGDVMLGRLVNEHLNQTEPAYVWGDLLPLLLSMDINLINLETALTTSERRVLKVFNFKAGPEKVRTLKEGRIDVVNLANNHVLDFSEEGLVETLKTLDQADIQHVGAGLNAQEAEKPVIITHTKMKIGILGCTDNEPDWKATAWHSGTFYLEVGDTEMLRKSIGTLRAHVDFLILSIHWGPNMRERPLVPFRKFAHELIDLGVDLIHGHSAHIFQGVEIYKNKVILYDTGDFVDDYAVDPYLRNDHSFFFLVEADEKRICTLRLIPVVISKFRVNRAQGEEAREIMRRMQLLSKEFQTVFEIEKNELIFRF